MGPTIILDKSALQRLSHDELLRLSCHYIVAAPQVLIYELLGDLSKDQARPEKSEGLVISLSRNLRAAMPKVCADTRDMVLDNLLGHPMSFDGRIPLAGGVPVVDREGKHGWVFDVAPEMEATFRWHLGRFTEDERAQSLHWRESMKALDMEAFQRNLRKLHPRLDGVKSIDDVMRFVDHQLALTSYQSLFVQWVCLEARVPAAAREVVLKRWYAQQAESLLHFAPYAHHFLRVSMAFYIGLQVGAVTTRKSNWIDVEYLRYLPFCHVFCSGDQLQIDFAKAMIRADHDLIDADALKADMARLKTWWQGLSEAERREESAEYGSQPPDLDNSPTAMFWRKRFGPRKKGRGNFALKMTPEQNKALYEKLRPSLEAAEAALNAERKRRQEPT